MRRLICAFVVRIWQKRVFPWHGSFDHCFVLVSFWLLSKVLKIHMHRRRKALNVANISDLSLEVILEPCHEKTCLQGFRPGKTQTDLLSYRGLLEAWNFEFSQYRHYTNWVANNKGADKTAQMRRLICTFVVRIWLKQVFSWRGSLVSHITSSWTQH